MKSLLPALALAAGLSLPAPAQQAAPSEAAHAAHHPEATPAQTTAPAASARAQMGNGLAPEGGMMQGGMMGQGGQWPGGMMSGTGPTMMMHCPMMPGDMARIEAAFGKDPRIRELAQSTVTAQEQEIATMRSWLAANAEQ
jgi:uncharacterized protein (DUF305 family)